MSFIAAVQLCQSRCIVHPFQQTFIYTNEMSYEQPWNRNVTLLLFPMTSFGEKKLIHGVKFTIPMTMATGTNLSSDTHLSIESLPRAKNCTGETSPKGRWKSL